MNAGEVIRLDSANEALKLHFLAWQCRVRQIIMRDHEGKPGDAIIPEVLIDNDEEPIGHIITLICKSAQYSKVPELKHMVRKTHDPADRRKNALTLFSETYYQKASEFSDVLTSTFQRDSEGAARLRKAGYCRLRFNAYQQSFELHCKVWRLSDNNPLRQSTYWHNLLFNPGLPADTLVLGFEPDWSISTADPLPGQH
ncbi:MAG: hypothetical protein KTR32_33365 [Granulosicoccus sp.]|nr:hypothetical protein [Granulosicoccus sp.]